jgi:hypothetical protein
MDPVLNPREEPEQRFRTDEQFVAMSHLEVVP